ncbi:MAG: glutamate-cysteine ligase family protein [Pirellulaceae bacterium]
MTRSPLHLFEAFGVELEYMIVSRDTLSVLPITDRVMYEIAGAYEAEVEQGDISWSNELALHVIELKTTGPAASLEGLSGRFQENAARINTLLARFDARLMPTAMHPWMQPDLELKLWPHDYNAVYEAFDRIFDCRGHGWANLQSVHLNLPFCGDEEFGRLHAAIRVVLPLLPALAASSPFVEGRPSAWCDARLEMYRHNAREVPLVSGQVIPEPAWSREQYSRLIFEPLYAAIAPHDPEGILRQEWLNARGAIARFDRSTIEIRVLDVQECPAADLAICRATSAVLRGLVEQRWSSIEAQQAMTTESLAALLSQTIRDADQAVVGDADYLRLFGLEQEAGLAAGELWRRLLKDCDLPAEKQADDEPLRILLEEGPLARRILRRTEGDYSHETLARVYGELCDCLEHGRMLRADG